MEKQLIRQLEATPGVVAATPILSEPFIGQSFYISKLARVEQRVMEREQNPFVPYEFGGPDYFRTLAIPILRGRGFTSPDTRSAEQVVVVSETLARKFWPNESALGKRLVSVAGATGNKTYTVVGVASDTHFRELRNAGPVAYFSWEQVGLGFPSLVAVRTTRPLPAILPALRAASRDVNQRLVVWKAQTMDQLLDAPLAQPRMSALLLTSFSGLALLLSALGLYGVISATVRQQTRNIAVRVALGATARDVYRLVLREAVWVLGLGGFAGLVTAVLSGQVLSAQLFQVRPLDPLSLGCAAALLVAIGLVAAMLPARRATRVDPITALRAE
jgi:predicted permease